MSALRNTRAGKSAVAGLVFVLIVGVLGMGLLRPTPAHAQGGISSGLAQVAGAVAACKLDDLLGDAIDTATDFVGDLFGFDIGGGGEDTVPVDDLINNDRECLTDGLFKAFANWVLQELTHSIITWINNGFEGRPAFVTDLKQFFLDAADRAIGEYIYGSDLDFLCSPFEADIRLALALQYQDFTHNPVECTLTDVLDNADDFFAGNFAAGGFARWFEMTSTPQNNPYGALLTAQGELETRIADETFRKEFELSLGDGFMSYEKCVEVEAGDHPGRGNEGEPYCYITTPGHTISEMLTFQLNTGSMQLIEADEINESISAIVSALAAKVLEKGLSGLNDDGYLDSYRAASPTGIEGGAGGTSNTGETIHGGSSESLLWKPASENDGRLVVLTPTSFGTPSVRILDANGNVIETGRYSGHHNGNRAHYRFNRPGSGYPAGSVLAVDGNRYTLSNGPASRNQGGDLRNITQQANASGGSGSAASSRPSSSEADRGGR